MLCASVLHISGRILFANSLCRGVLEASPYHSGPKRHLAMAWRRRQATGTPSNWERPVTGNAITLIGNAITLNGNAGVSQERGARSVESTLPPAPPRIMSNRSSTV